MIAYFLPAILVLGIITSYEDIKYGKIRNKWIIAALIYAALTYAILIPYYYLNSEMNTRYLIELASNISLSIIAGYALWHYSIWSAGDGKLFIAFASLIPLTEYSNGYQQWFPAMTFLTNIFMLGLAFLIGTGMTKIKKEHSGLLKVLMKKLINPKEFVKSILAIFSLYWIMMLLLSSIGIDSFLFRMASMMLIYPLSQKLAGKKDIVLMIGIAIARIIFDNSIYSVRFLKDFAILIIIWHIIVGFISGAISRFSKEIFSDEIRINDLKKGMNVSDIIEKRGVIGKKEMEILKKDSMEIIRIKKKDAYYVRGKEGNSILKEAPEGIGKKDIEFIKKMGFKKINISRTIPFAPFVFLSALFTLLAKGNILIYARSLF